MGDLAALLLEGERRLAEADPTDSGLADLLADDFIEFGASGSTWTRGATISEVLAGGRRQVEIVDFTVEKLSRDVALATYRSVTTTQVALRSSVWVLRDGRWQIRFHQGTRFAPRGS
jgi:hypothetical protein